MSKTDLKEVLAELAARKSVSFDINKFCFKEQLAFINDPNPYATAVCSVRAGKTIACAADLVYTALNKPGTASLYITLARSNAKRIIWPELIKINEEYNLGARVNETDLSITFPNGSIIYCSGAKDKSEIEKFRGLALVLCYIDECQAFRAYIRDLVDDVIVKRLYDYNGRLRLIGTPGPIPAGYFYECSVSKQWGNHHWTLHNNPHIERKSGKTVADLIDQDCKRKGVTIDDPAIQRECFGRWSIDTNSLVFRYNSSRNHYDKLPETKHKWNYVIGIDLGFDDADAIAVMGWQDHSKSVFLIEENIQAKQGITALGYLISELISKYDPIRIVMDTGGLGKKIADEIRRRHQIPIQAAEKSRKFEFIELLNDALRTRVLYARNTSRFAQDTGLVEWDKDVTNGRLKIKDNYHSDICDAVLYAYREALHWLESPEILKPKRGTKEYIQAEIEAMEKAAEQAYEKSKKPTDDDWSFIENEYDD